MDEAMETVDQYVFRWDAANPSGGTGFGAVAWSGDHHTAQGIQRSLGRTLEVAGENAVPGLVRVDGKMQVVLGHRTLGRDPGGRAGTICHALVGRKEWLSPDGCLALHAWRWQRADVPVEIVRGSLPAVPLDLLTLGRDEELDRLADELREPATVRALVTLTAEVLRDPDRRFSVLDPSAGREPHALLLGLWRVFGSLLETHPLGWSFATHDTDDAKPLRFVFLPTWPAHPPSNDQHVRLDPWKQRAGRTDRAEGVARDLVAWILEAVPGTVNRTLARHAPREHTGRGKRTWLLETAERAVRRDSPTPRRGPTPPPPPRTETLPPTYTPTPAPNPAPTPTPARPPAEARPPATPSSGSWLGFEEAQRAAAGTPPDDHEAEKLVEAVRVMDGSDPGLPALLAKIQDRQPRWPRSLRLHYCWTLLNRRLLLHAWLGDTDTERATAVAKLYQQAVRPFAEEPDVADKLTEVLLEERRLSREHPAARAALTHIVHHGTGLPSEHLSELLAHIWSEEPARTSSPPPVTGWDERPIPPTPEPPPPSPHARVTQTNRRWGASKLESPEKVMVAIGSGVVFLFILLFTLLLTR